MSNDFEIRLKEPISTDQAAETTLQDGGTNRGEDTKFVSQQAPVYVTLELINDVIIDYLKNKIQPSIVENETSRPVPILYGSAERWASIQKEGVIRDQGKLQCPLIVLRRTSISRNNTLTNPMNKYFYLVFENKYNSHNAYEKYIIQNDAVRTKRWHNVVIPDYVDLTYEALIWTEYQAQMDQVVEQINFEADEYWGDRNQYKFRVQIEEFISQSQLPVQTDRVIRMAFDMKISAYIIPERMVKNFKLLSTNITTYTAKKLVTFGPEEGIVTQIP